MARTLDLLILAGTVFLSIRLFSTGLYSRYRVFFSYLVFAALRTGLLSVFSIGSDAYEYLWVITEPLEWLFYVMVVLEIYSLVLQDYKGLSTVGRWLLITAVTVALFASGLSLMAPSQYTTQGHLMHYYYVAERAVYFSLVVFLVSILGLLMQYPISLSRNIIVHSMVFSVYFLGNTVLYLLVSMRSRGTLIWLSLAFAAVTLAALGAWLVMLKPSGEGRKQSLRPQWMPGREEELVSQLNHLNAALLRVARK